MRRSRVISLPPASPKKEYFKIGRNNKNCGLISFGKKMGDTILLSNGVEIRNDAMGKEISSKTYVFPK